MNNKKITNIPKSFDDKLESLIGFISKTGWKLPDLDPKVLELDLKEQRDERKKDAELILQAEQFHREFMSKQSLRYQRYMKVLTVLRAICRDKPDMLKALESFKLTSGRKKSTETKK